MKISEQRKDEAHRQHTEAIVAGPLAELFKRLPMLSGFWLRPDPEAAELSIVTWPAEAAGRALWEEVMQSLAALADAHPDAVQLMSGRTFARAVH